LEGGDFISSLSDSIDSIRRSEEVDGVRLSYILPRSDVADKEIS
jgi:hypothetical protein